MLAIKGTKRQIFARSIWVELNVVGVAAETTVRGAFWNGSGEEEEAELELALAEGANVSGWAIDVRGEMVSAVPVEKEVACVAYEIEARARRPGPAVVEKMAGNTFKARVYPLSAHGSRTIQLTVSSQLIHTSHGFSYSFPLIFPDRYAIASLRFPLRALVIYGPLWRYWRKWKQDFGRRGLTSSIQSRCPM